MEQEIDESHTVQIKMEHDFYIALLYKKGKRSWRQFLYEEIILKGDNDEFTGDVSQSTQD